MPRVHVQAGRYEPVRIVRLDLAGQARAAVHASLFKK